MHYQFYDYTLVFILFSVVFCNAGFRGGSINWVKLKGMGVRFTYRLTWQRGSGPCGPDCSIKNLNKNGSLSASLSTLKWTCTSGCGHSMSLNDVNYVVTSVGNISSGWEQGEGQFFHNLSSASKQFEITLDQLIWSSSISGAGRLITTVDLRSRNDTNLPNASPIAAVQPFIGIPFGCRSVINLPVEDPDADDVRCRLATMFECGDACTDLPKFKLHDENCSITIDASLGNGYKPNTTHRLTVMMEDFPDYNVAVGKDNRNPRHPFCKIPLQVSINVIETNDSCNISNVVHFTDPGIKDNLRIPYQGTAKVILPYYLRAPDIDHVRFLESMPAGASYDRLYDDVKNRTDVVRAYAQWIPGPNQFGDAFFCLWNIQTNGITGAKKRCITIYALDDDHCTRNAKDHCAQNGGQCVDLYQRFTCKCPHGFKPLNCTEPITCKDFPCHHNSTCVDTGTFYRCMCLPGYTGVDCEEELDHPTRQANSKEDETTPVWPVIVGTVATVAVLIIAGCCLWWLWGAAAWRRRQLKIQPSLLTPSSSRPSSAMATRGSTPMPLSSV